MDKEPSYNFSNNEDIVNSRSSIPPESSTLLRRRNKPIEPDLINHDFKEKIKKIDFFSKTSEDAVTNTKSGLVLTIITLVLMVVLLVHEYQEWDLIRIQEYITVDKTPNERLEIYFDISFHHLQCSKCNFDIMDVSGEHVEDLSHGISRQRLYPDGSPVSDEITDDRIIEDKEDEGCRVKGTIEMSKVAGNIHVAVGGVHQSEKNEDQKEEPSRSNSRYTKYRLKKHIHKFKMGDMKHFNAKHTINQLRFGKHFPGQVEALSNLSINAPSIAHYQHFIKIVPTTHIDLAGNEVFSNQYSASSKTTVINLNNPTSTGGIPGVFFIYDFSPFRIEVREYKLSTFSFMINVFAIIGGALAIVLLLYGVYRSIVDKIKEIIYSRQKFSRLSDLLNSENNNTSYSPSSTNTSIPPVVQRRLSDKEESSDLKQMEIINKTLL